MGQSSPQPLSIAPLSDALLAKALLIRCAPEQSQFVETAERIINSRKPSEDIHLVCRGDDVIGLFKIDRGYAAEMPFCKEGQLGLRGFVIDVAAQGQGIGRQISAMLGEYLAQGYAGFSSLLLTVNCKNIQAQRAYLKGGFADTGDLFHGGSAGPQHIYRKEIASRQASEQTGAIPGTSKDPG